MNLDFPRKEKRWFSGCKSKSSDPIIPVVNKMPAHIAVAAGNCLAMKLVITSNGMVLRPPDWIGSRKKPSPTAVEAMNANKLRMG
jgi:hypothetical protein